MWYSESKWHLNPFSSRHCLRHIWQKYFSFADLLACASLNSLPSAFRTFRYTLIYVLQLDEKLPSPPNPPAHHSRGLQEEASSHRQEAQPCHRRRGSQDELGRSGSLPERFDRRGLEPPEIGDDELGAGQANAPGEPLAAKHLVPGVFHSPAADRHRARGYHLLCLLLDGEERRPQSEAEEAEHQKAEGRSAHSDPERFSTAAEPPPNLKHHGSHPI